jgi:RNA polymerase sigma-70 factor (ECF subfamily)
LQKLTVDSDNDLIIEARNGNENAFSALVHRYDRRVLSIIANFVQSSDDAKDIYQEVFIRVYKALPKFEFRSEFSTWLYRITTNVCLTYRARHKKSPIRRLQTDGFDGAGSDENLHGTEEHAPHLALLSSELHGKMRAAIDSLPPQQKMVFVLKHLNEYKIKDIALMMECSEGSVKKYLFLAVHKLRSQLKEIES